MTTINPIPPDLMSLIPVSGKVKEDSDAERDSGGEVRAARQETGLGSESVCGLPSVYGAELQNGEKPQTKRKRGPIPGYRRPPTERFREPKDLEGLPLPKNIKATIKEVNGDVYLAAMKLGMNFWRLDQLIRYSKPLMKYVAQLKELPHGRAYKDHSVKWLLADIQRRSVVYKGEALEGLRELAMMPLSENSGLMQVKLLAASKLYGEGNVAMGETINQTLAVLNTEFHSTAKKIRAIRETTREVEFETSPGAIDVSPS